MNIYDYSVKNAAGEDVSLKQYEGKVLLVVNTATGCGFTPQYKELEEMYEAYHQTPGTDEEIHEFCTLKYNTQFPQMKKSEVNGEGALPLYGYLKEQQGFQGFGKGAKAAAFGVMMKKFDKDYKNNPDIKWNFTKFLVDREGRVVARFEPTHSMADVDAAVKALL